MSILQNGLISKLEFTEVWQAYATLIGFVVISILVSYFLGCINSAIIISKLLYKDDIRNHGSGNAGMTNMLRTYGLKAAALTLVGDMLKTLLAVLITGLLLGFHYGKGISLGDGYCYMAGLFAVLGHVFPIYYRFKGGKGVLATATLFLILAPLPFAILFLLFVVIVSISRFVSLGSVSAAVLLPVVSRAYIAVVFGTTGMPAVMSISLIILAILVVWCHRENLKRISQGTERKISIGGKKNKDE